MWRKAGLVAVLIGSLWLCASAEEASTPALEDEALTGDPDPDPGAISEGPTEELTTDSPPSTEDLPENATEPDLPETSDDGLETATLVGIIVGIIVAIGVATAVIVAVVKRASGRYS